MNQIFDWNFAWSITPVLLSSAIVTVQATVIGFVAAAILGLPLALARRSRVLIISWSVAFLIEFIRSTPLLMQVYFIFFVGPQFGVTLPPMVAGLIAISLYFGCFISEVYIAALDSVPKAQWEAVVALNLSRPRAYKDIILPQAIPPMIPVLGNYFIDMFKATPILSVISVVEMMSQAKLIGSETFRYVEPITLIGVFFLLMTLAASLVVRRLEVVFGPKGRTGVIAREQVVSGLAST